MAEPRVLVVCVGNDLVADDAAGFHLHERLAREPLPPSVTLLMLGVGGIRLLDELDGQDLLILCDAVQLGAPAGTIHRLAWEDVPSSPGPAVSAHGIGLPEVMSIAQALFPEKLPRRALLIGIEGACFDRVGPPTPEVMAAVEPAAAAVLRAITDLTSP